ncbi:MAG: hypothetical protein WD425_19540 [Nitrospirales bacterium]
MIKLTEVVSAACIAGIVALTVPAFAQTTVTSFAPKSDPPPVGVWYEADVRTGGTASVSDLTGVEGDLENNQPLPIGAAKLTTDLTNEAKAEVAIINNYGQADTIIPTLEIGYSWHKASNAGQNLNAAPSLKLTFYNPVCDQTTSEDCFATLVYEAYQNGFGNEPPLDEWQRSDLNQNVGGWWTTGGFGAPDGMGGCGPTPCPTLLEWLDTLSLDFGQADLVAVSVGVGSYNPGQIGYFDNVVITGTNADASYDFEPAPQFETLGQCTSSLIADNCTGLTGKARATCNHEQQMACFDLFNIQ